MLWLDCCRATADGESESLIEFADAVRSDDVGRRDVKKFPLWQGNETMRQWDETEKKSTRKAHLKINKVSVDFLISSLMASTPPPGCLSFHLPPPLPAPSWWLEEKEISPAERKLFFFRPPRGFRPELFLCSPRFGFYQQQNVSSNIEKSNYWECSWTRRQIKLNCLLCETVKRTKKTRETRKLLGRPICTGKGRDKAQFVAGHDEEEAR